MAAVCKLQQKKYPKQPEPFMPKGAAAQIADLDGSF
jgi:hypothetical protein